MKLFLMNIRFLITLLIVGLSVSHVEAQTPEDGVFLEVLKMERSCTELLMRYGRAQDERRLDLMEGLFAKEAIWEAVNGPKVEGEQNILSFWATFFNKPRPSVGTHVLTNVRITSTGENIAHGTAYVTMYRYDPKAIKSLAPLLFGETILDFERVDGQWKIKHFVLDTVTVKDYVHGEN